MRKEVRIVPRSQVRENGIQSTLQVLELREQMALSALIQRCLL